MSNCQIRFQYNQEDVIIQCQKNELMRDIIGRYCIKAGLTINEFYFLYDGTNINLDMTLSQINDKDTEIKILVYSNENEENLNKKEESNYIKSALCQTPAILEFSNDYTIDFLDGKNEKKKIKLQDYNNTQIVDICEIKCSKCAENKANTYQGKFYYCFECEKNFCPMCQSLHQEHKNIIDYSLKYFKCLHHKDQNFISYCFNCKKNLCVFCKNQHKEHNIINFDNMIQEQKQNKQQIEKIQKVTELVDNIIDSLQKFKENLGVYLQINKKLNENFSKMNLNYENLKTMKNLMEMSFLNKDIEEILNIKDISKTFQKIFSIYIMMNDNSSNVINIYNKDNENDKKSTEEINEITLKIMVEENELNKNIYFLDNTQESDWSYIGYYEDGKYIKHNHDNLNEMNETNITLIIDEKTIPFQKFFKPTKTGLFFIKLLFKIKLSNCAYMFCKCKNIIDIDFSKFKTENVTNMQYMFCSCSKLKSLDLKSFNTQNVTNMKSMFNECSSLIKINLSSFNTSNVTEMRFMFKGCSFLSSLNLSSFKTENVISMYGMFYKCKSLISLNLSSFNTKNVLTMKKMFSECYSLRMLNLSSFNATKANTEDMFAGCKNLLSCGSSDKNIVDSFNKK